MQQTWPLGCPDAAVSAAPPPHVLDTRAESYFQTLPDLGDRQREVLAVLAAAPAGLTAWEVQARVLERGEERLIHAIRPRLTELAKVGVVEKCGRRWWEPTQRNEWVWRIRPMGQLRFF